MCALDVETGYRMWSASYDGDVNRTRDLDAVALRASGIAVSGREIVEIGCGTGKNSVWLADGARSLLGLDLSDAMLAKARARGIEGSVRFERHDIRMHWPMVDASADLVIGNLVLEHIRDLGVVFCEAARVLRSGGELFVSELHPYRQLVGGGARLSDAPGARIEAFVHTIGEYVNAAIACGFSLRHLDEWKDETDRANPAALPRLLTIRFVRT